MKETTKRYFIILGDKRVGKTFFVDRLNGKKVEQDHSYATGGSRQFVKNELTNNEEWEIHDFEGEIELDEKFDLKNIQYCIIMYDITDKPSFDKIREKYFNQIKNHEHLKNIESSNIIIVGHNCIYEEKREVKYADGKDLADHLGFKFIEASAEENINVAATFETLIGKKPQSKVSCTFH